MYEIIKQFHRFQRKYVSLNSLVLELHLDGGGDDGPGDLAPVLLPDLRQLLLHELVQDPVLLADVVPHDSLQGEESSDTVDN